MGLKSPRTRQNEGSRGFESAPLRHPVFAFRGESERRELGEIIVKKRQDDDSLIAHPIWLPPLYRWLIPFRRETRERIPLSLRRVRVLSSAR